MAAELNKLSRDLDQRGYTAAGDLIREVTQSLLRNGLLPENLAEEQDVSPMTTNIGHTIRSIRKSRGDTQKVLAAQAGIHPYSLRRIEAGTTNPRAGTIRDLANALEVPVSALLQSKNQHSQ